MTTTITLPKYLAELLQQRANAQHRPAELLAIEYIEAGLSEPDTAAPDTDQVPLDPDAELLALVARIKAMPPNPANIIPAKGNLAEVLQALEALEIEDYDLDTELAALTAAEAELKAMNHADDIAEGRG